MEPNDSLDTALFQKFQELELGLARNEPHDQLIAAYEAIADEFARRYEQRGDPVKALATRQSVAASIVLVAMTANRPLDECKRHFQQMVRLGFADLNREAHELLVFCGYWLRRGGDSDTARVYLEPLRAELQAGQERDPAPAWREYLQRCDKLLAPQVP